MQAVQGTPGPARQTELLMLLIPHTDGPRRAGTLAALAIVLACAPAGGALEPEEVLVVANAGSAESVALANSYASARSIPKRNIVLLKTSTAFKVSRRAYETGIKQPIVRVLRERRLRERIRGVALMWGVPGCIRPGVPATAAPATQVAAGPLRALYAAAAEKAHYRLQMNYSFLPSVAGSFPKPRTDGLTPVAKLFPLPPPRPPKKLMDVDDLNKKLRRLLARKQVAVGMLADPKKKQIAERQMMAMHLDIYGLKGLIAYVKDAKVAGAPPLKQLQAQATGAEGKLDAIRRREHTVQNAKARLELLAKTGGLALVSGYARQQAGIKSPSKGARRKTGPLEQAGASVDSELALLWWPQYPAKGMKSNPLHWRMAAVLKRKKVPPTLMTARIDGPAAACAKRIIADSVAVEKVGLKGVFYIDAGLIPRFAKGKSKGYLAYDNRLRALHSFVSTHTSMKIVMDTGPTLFKPGTCPDAALYAGWYSLKKYVPAFKWNRGAVGWHTASFEAASLRNPNSHQWCPQMLRNGVAATVGPVAEPLLYAFPAPEEFYPLLLTGKYTIAECYWRTTTTASWQMMLIADPLYNPFKANPRVSLRSLPPGLAP